MLFRSNDTATTEIYTSVHTLSLHDALPISAGVSQFTPLAAMYAHVRTLRLADGPDEVHKMTIARREIRRRAPEIRL